jgi:hypothetical protein
MFANNWTASNSGIKIDLVNPTPEMFTIKDIAGALSKLCRFNGQLKTFYSVAQHSVHVSELVPERLKLAALFHDASEAYICDIPTPFKRMLGTAYTDTETKIQSAIGEKFGITQEEFDDPLIKQADRIMVVSERDTFQTNPQKWSDEYENVLRYPGVLIAKAHAIAGAMFIKTYYNYVGVPAPVKPTVVPDDVFMPSYWNRAPWAWDTSKRL